MTRFRYLGAGVAASGLALAWGRGEPPWGTTLAVLPLAIALLETVRRELGGPAPRGAQALLGAGWLAFALHGQRLGLDGSAPLAAVALALLAAWRVADLVPALRRRLDRARGRWPTWPFAALPLAVGMALLPWVHSAHEPNGDEPYFLLLAESFVSDLDFDLADEYRAEVSRRFTEQTVAPQPGDWQGPGGERRSRHESLLAVYLAPFWWVGGAGAARFGMVVLWALLAERLLALGRAAGVPARGALRAWLTATFAAPLAVYATQIWVETAAALALAIALERWLRSRANEAAGEGAFAAALLALPLLKLRLLAVALPVAVLGALERRRRSTLLVTTALVAVAALAFWRNDHLVGRALGVYLASDFLPMSVDARDYLLGLGGLGFDLAFGLFAAAPLWLLAIAGVRPLFARRGAAALSLLVGVPYLAVVASLRSWYGGWCPPFRYGVVLLPVATLALGFALSRRPARAERLLAGTLGLASALLVLLFVAQPGWATSFADGRSRVVDLAAVPFAADLARLLPSALRPRTATWLAPLLAVVLLGLVRADPRRRLRSPPLVAAGALLSGFALFLVAAHYLPTRVAEVEDPWISRGIGELYPELWAIDRTSETGGLALLPADPPREVAPVPGGGRVAIRVALRAHPANRAALALRLAVGAEEIGRVAVPPGSSWRTEALAERAWSAGDRLRLEVLPAEGAQAAPGDRIVVDRVELDWR